MSDETVTRLFDEQIARQWDWSQAHSRALPDLRQAVADAVAGHLDEPGLAAVARRVTGNHDAGRVLAEQCRAVVRTARLGES